MYTNLTAENTLSNLHTSSSGLTQETLEQLREQYGYNELPQKKKSLILLFFQQFNDVLVYILIGALVLSVVTPFLEDHAVTLRSFADAIVIFAILLLNALLGFIQEFKAEEAIAMLEKLTSPNTHVRRDGVESIISSRELLPGDIVVLEEGDKVSADMRLLSTSHLRTNESSLTGESHTIQKHSDAIEGEPPLAERYNMVFSGTLIAAGSGEAVVTAIGVQTEIGKIAKLVSETVIPETPLQLRLKKLGKALGAVVLLFCFIVLGIGIFKQMSFMHVFLIAVSLAVSAVPEGLPAVVTVCFAMGVKRMVKKNALVRRLDALETLGSVTVICSDKTGTITENKMKVEEVWVADNALATEKLLIEIAASCNRAKLPDMGDPTEIGLLEYAQAKHIDQIPFDEEEVPFSSEAKYMQTRHGERSFIKGAPEKVIALCDDVHKEETQEQDSTMAKRGLRVLGCAVRQYGKTTFIGLVGMNDPPRASVQRALQEAADAGIRTVMITGDNIETAKAIGQRIGLKGDAMHGDQLDDLPNEDYERIVRYTAIYARVSPVHKLKILEALQRNGEIVAMSGDGVNDAPALKGAHVGIAMGKVGTQVAREASSMVLADDHFSTIVSAIREGRRIYDNIRKFVLFLLRANFDELLLIMTTLVLGIPIPYLPIHILWINLMTDGLPALALGLEKAEPDIMQRKPRPPEESILSGEWNKLFLAAFCGFAASFFFFTYLYYIREYTLEHSRTLTLTMAMLFELLLAFSVRSHMPIWKVGIFSNKWLIAAVSVPLVAQLFLLYSPLAEIFYLVPMSTSDWMITLPMAFTGVIIFECIKLVHLPSYISSRKMV